GEIDRRYLEPVGGGKLARKPLGGCELLLPAARQFGAGRRPRQRRKILGASRHPIGLGRVLQVKRDGDALARGKRADQLVGQVGSPAPGERDADEHDRGAISWRTAIFRSSRSRTAGATTRSPPT